MDRFSYDIPPSGDMSLSLVLLQSATKMLVVFHFFAALSNVAEKLPSFSSLIVNVERYRKFLVSRDHLSQWHPTTHPR